MGNEAIYLAGKITGRENDWRHPIVKGLHGMYYGDCGGNFTSCDTPSWEVLPNAVFGLDYTGPYFIDDKHGCCYGDNTHGCSADNKRLLDHSNRQQWVTEECMNAIKRSDILFAWLADTTCYGTLVEIGYAKALGKTIWIAGTNPQWRDEDLWFSCSLADMVFLETWLDPAFALRTLIAKSTYRREPV